MCSSDLRGVAGGHIRADEVDELGGAAVGDRIHRGDDVLAGGLVRRVHIRKQNNV